MVITRLFWVVMVAINLAAFTAKPNPYSIIGGLMSAYLVFRPKGGFYR